MKYTTYDKLYTEFYTEFEHLAVEDGYHPDDDFEVIEERMAEALADVGFSEAELDEIFNGKPCPKTLYKFIAYKLLTYNDFYDEATLIQRLSDAGISLDEVTDDDLTNILIAREDVNY